MGRISAAARRRALLASIAIRFGLLEKQEINDEKIEDSQDMVNDFLLIRGVREADRKDWFSDLHKFFVSSFGYADCLGIREYLASEMNLNPCLPEEGDRSKFFREVAIGCGLGGSSGSIETWKRRTAYPSFGQLKTAGSALIKNIDGFRQASEIECMRFALCRTTSYLLAYPWPNTSLLRNHASRKNAKITEEIITKLKIVGADTKNLGKYMYQPVLDKILEENPALEVNFSKLKSLNSEKTRFNLFFFGRQDDVIGEFDLLKLFLIFGDYSGKVAVFSWVWNQNDPRSVKLWGDP